MSLRGRISRQTYWLWFVVPIFILNMLATIIDISLGTYDWESGLGPVSGMGFLITFWPNVVSIVKRLHDRDMTGGHLAALAGSGVLVLVLVALMSLVSEDFVLVAGSISLLAWFGYLMYLFISCGFLRGTQGPNRYGPIPLR